MKNRNGGGVAQSESEKAAEFNGLFTDVFTKSENSQVPLLDRSAPFMEDIVVTMEGVTKLLKGLNPSKSKRKAMNRNWSNQKANPALNTKAGNK